MEPALDEGGFSAVPNKRRSANVSHKSSQVSSQVSHSGDGTTLRVATAGWTMCIRRTHLVNQSIRSATGSVALLCSGVQQVQQTLLSGTRRREALIQRREGMRERDGGNGGESVHQAGSPG